MTSPSGALALLFLLVAVLPAWMVIEGFATGVVRVRGGRCARSERPVWFWTVMAMYLGLIAWFAYLGARLALGI